MRVDGRLDVLRLAVSPALHCVAAAVLALSAGDSVLAEEKAASPRPVRLMLLWTHQSQFAGYYVAKEKGLFRRRGVELEIIRGGPDRDPVKYLEAGKTDFAVLWLASALAAVDRGVPIAHVAQVFNSSNLAIVGWKEKGVETVRDLDGRRVSVWGDPFRPAFSAFFNSQNIAPTIVTQYSTVNLFLLRGVDACSVMNYNEYHVLHQSGVDESEISRFSLKDHGIDFPEDGIYCLRRTRESQPDVCKALVGATMEGWRYAAEHLEETVDLVMRYVTEANLATNRTHMRWMLRAVIASVFPEKDADWEPGVLGRKSYDEAAQWLRELEEVRRAPSYEEFLR